MDCRWPALVEAASIMMAAEGLDGKCDYLPDGLQPGGLMAAQFGADTYWAYQDEMMMETDYYDDALAAASNRQPPARRKAAKSQAHNKAAIAGRTKKDGGASKAAPAHVVTHHQPSKSAIPGGPCMHCGAMDSPQWRRPIDRDQVLCNACGIYYGRHHRLPPHKKAAFIPLPSQPVTTSTDALPSLRAELEVGSEDHTPAQCSPVVSINTTPPLAYPAPSAPQAGSQGTTPYAPASIVAGHMVLRPQAAVRSRRFLRRSGSGLAIASYPPSEEEEVNGSESIARHRPLKRERLSGTAPPIGPHISDAGNEAGPARAPERSVSPVPPAPASPTDSNLSSHHCMRYHGPMTAAEAAAAAAAEAAAGGAKGGSPPAASIVGAATSIHVPVARAKRQRNKESGLWRSGGSRAADDAQMNRAAAHPVYVPPRLGAQASDAGMEYIPAWAATAATVAAYGVVPGAGIHRGSTPPAALSAGATAAMSYAPGQVVHLAAQRVQAAPSLRRQRSPGLGNNGVPMAAQPTLPAVVAAVPGDALVGTAIPPAVMDTADVSSALPRDGPSTLQPSPAESYVAVEGPYLPPPAIGPAPGSAHSAAAGAFNPLAPGPSPLAIAASAAPGVPSGGWVGELQSSVPILLRAVASQGPRRMR